MDSSVGVVLSPTMVKCVAPPWGSVYPWLDDGATFSLLHGSQGDFFSGTNPGTNHPPIQQHGVLTYGGPYRQNSDARALPRYGPNVQFHFYPVWSTYSHDNTYGAKGGDDVRFVASGLRPEFQGLYVCIFTSPDKREMRSEYVNATDVKNVICPTPEWGADFIQSNVSLQLMEVYMTYEIYETEIELLEIERPTFTYINATNTSDAMVIEGLEVIDKEQTNFVGFSHYVTLGASQPLPFQGSDLGVYNITTTEVLVAETLFGIQHLYTYGGHHFRNKYEFFQILLRVVEYPNSYITNVYNGSAKASGNETVLLEGSGKSGF